MTEISPEQYRWVQTVNFDWDSLDEPIEYMKQISKCATSLEDFRDRYIYTRKRLLFLSRLASTGIHIKLATFIANEFYKSAESEMKTRNMLDNKGFKASAGDLAKYDECHPLTSLPEHMQTIWSGKSDSGNIGYKPGMRPLPGGPVKKAKAKWVKQNGQWVQVKPQEEEDDGEEFEEVVGADGKRVRRVVKEGASRAKKGKAGVTQKTEITEKGGGDDEEETQQSQGMKAFAKRKKAAQESKQDKEDEDDKDATVLSVKLPAPIPKVDLNGPEPDLSKMSAVQRMIYEKRKKEKEAEEAQHPKSPSPIPASQRTGAQKPATYAPSAVTTKIGALMSKYEKDVPHKMEKVKIKVLNGKKMMIGPDGTVLGEYKGFIPGEGNWKEGEEYGAYIRSNYVESTGPGGAKIFRPAYQYKGDTDPGPTETRKVTVKNGSVLVERKPDDPILKRDGEKAKYEGEYTGYLKDEAKMEEGKSYTVQIPVALIKTIGPAGNMFLHDAVEVAEVGGDESSPTAKAEKRTIEINDGRKMLLRKEDDPQRSKPGEEGQFEAEYTGRIPGEEKMKEGKKYDILLKHDCLKTEGVLGKREIKSVREAVDVSHENATPRQIEIVKSRKMLIKEDYDGKSKKEEDKFNGEIVGRVDQEQTFEEGKTYNSKIIDLVTTSGPEGRRILRTQTELSNPNLGVVGAAVEHDQGEPGNDKKQYKVKVKDGKKILVDEDGKEIGEYMGYIPGEEHMKDGETYDVVLSTNLVKTLGPNKAPQYQDPTDARGGMGAQNDWNGAEKEERTIEIKNGKKMLLRKEDDPLRSLPGDEGLYEGEYAEYIPGEEEWKDGDTLQVEIPKNYVTMKGPNGTTVLRHGNDKSTTDGVGGKKKSGDEVALEKKTIKVINGKKMVLDEAGNVIGEYMGYIPGEENWKEGEQYDVLLKDDYRMEAGPNGQAKMYPRHAQSAASGIGEARKIEIKDGKKMLLRKDDDPLRSLPGDEGKYEGEIVDHIPDEENFEEGKVYNVNIGQLIPTVGPNGDRKLYSAESLHPDNAGTKGKAVKKGSGEPGSETEKRKIKVVDGKKMLLDENGKEIGEYMGYIPGEENWKDGEVHDVMLPVNLVVLKGPNGKTKVYDPADTDGGLGRSTTGEDTATQERKIKIVNGKKMIFDKDGKMIGEYMDYIPGEEKWKDGEEHMVQVPIDLRVTLGPNGQKQVRSGGSGEEGDLEGENKKASKIRIRDGKKYIVDEDGNEIGEYKGYIPGQEYMKEGEEYTVMLPAGMIETTGPNGEKLFRDPASFRDGFGDKSKEGEVKMKERTIKIDKSRKMLLRKKKDPFRGLPGEEGKYEGEYTPYLPGEDAMKEGKKYKVMIPKGYEVLIGPNGQRMIYNKAPKDDKEVKETKEMKIKLVNGKKMVLDEAGNVIGEYKGFIPGEEKWKEGEEQTVSIPDDYIITTAPDGTKHYVPRSGPTGTETRQIKIINGKKMLVDEKGNVVGEYQGYIPGEENMKEGETYNVKLSKGLVYRKGPNGNTMIYDPSDALGGLAEEQNDLPTQVRKIEIKDGRKMLLRKDDDPLRSLPGDEGKYEGEYMDYIEGQEDLKDGDIVEVNIPINLRIGKGPNGQTQIHVAGLSKEAEKKGGDVNTEKQVVKIINGKKMLLDEDGNVIGEYVGYIPGEENWKEGEEYEVMLKEGYRVEQGPNGAFKVYPRNHANADDENGETRKIEIKDGKKMLLRKDDDPLRSLPGDEGKYEGEIVDHITGEHEFKEGQTYDVKLGHLVRTDGPDGKPHLRLEANLHTDNLGTKGKAVKKGTGEPGKEFENRQIKIVNGKKMLLDENGNEVGEYMGYIPGEENWKEGETYTAKLSTNLVVTTGPNGQKQVRDPNNSQGGFGSDVKHGNVATQERKIKIINGKKMLYDENGNEIGEYMDYIPGEENWKEGEEHTVQIPIDVSVMIGPNGQKQVRCSGKDDRSHPNQTAVAPGDAGTEQRVIEIKNGKKMLLRKEDDPLRALPGDEGKYEGELIDYVPGEGALKDGDQLTITVNKNLRSFKNGSGETQLTSGLETGADENGEIATEKRSIRVDQGRKMLIRKEDDPKRKMSGEDGKFEGQWMPYIQDEETWKEGDTHEVDLPILYMIHKGPNGQNLINVCDPEEMKQEDYDSVEFEFQFEESGPRFVEKKAKIIKTDAEDDDLLANRRTAGGVVEEVLENDEESELLRQEEEELRRKQAEEAAKEGLGIDSSVTFTFDDRSEKMILHVYDATKKIFTHQAHKGKVDKMVLKKEGSFSYRSLELEQNQEKVKYIVHGPITSPQELNTMKCYAKTQGVITQFAKEFNDCGVPKKVTVARVGLLQFAERVGMPLFFAVQTDNVEYLSEAFNGEGDRFTLIDGTQTEHEDLVALQHYTFNKMNNEMLIEKAVGEITPLGYHFVMTEACSMDSRFWTGQSGAITRSKLGEFMSTHNCNKVCEMLSVEEGEDATETSEESLQIIEALKVALKSKEDVKVQVAMVPFVTTFGKLEICLNTPALEDEELLTLLVEGIKETKDDDLQQKQLAAMLILTHRANNRVRIAKLGAIPLILKLIESQYQSNADVVKRGGHIIWSLTRKESNRPIVRDNKGIAILANCVAFYGEKDADACQKACNVLWNMSTGEENKKAFMDPCGVVGGKPPKTPSAFLTSCFKIVEQCKAISPRTVLAVAGMLLNLSNNEVLGECIYSVPNCLQTVATATSAMIETDPHVGNSLISLIQNLGSDEKGAEKLVKQGTHKVLLKMGKDFSKKPDGTIVVDRVLSALTNMCACEAAISGLVNDGAIDFSVAIIKEHKEDAKLCKAALGVMREISAVEEFAEPIADQDVIDSILDVGDHYTMNDALVVGTALEIMVNLTASEDFRTMVAGEETLKKILQLLSSHVMIDEAVAILGVKVIANIAISDACQAEIANANGTDILVDILKKRAGKIDRLVFNTIACLSNVLNDDQNSCDFVDGKGIVPVINILKLCLNPTQESLTPLPRMTLNDEEPTQEEAFKPDVAFVHNLMSKCCSVLGNITFVEDNIQPLLDEGVMDVIYQYLDVFNQRDTTPAPATLALPVLNPSPTASICIRSILQLFSNILVLPSAREDLAKDPTVYKHLSNILRIGVKRQELISNGQNYESPDPGKKKMTIGPEHNFLSYGCEVMRKLATLPTGKVELSKINAIPQLIKIDQIEAKIQKDIERDDEDEDEPESGEVLIESCSGALTNVITKSEENLALFIKSGGLPAFKDVLEAVGTIIEPAAKTVCLGLMNICGNSVYAKECGSLGLAPILTKVKNQWKDDGPQTAKYAQSAVERIEKAK
ncbi:hypothetical protein BLNAU_9451 [Blattamonas nauphoetae]|uniref:Alpha-type protein kinase domain-containing protein n=1 Tax=Blattamonas nauphoetae TaxID=2049346 RepID=A0ABQ9XVT4_9EUKA|nr:hypothetical protein BLNAU_9451 [Blattamonas nauphoetae]